jgi:PAS domain S-box-containing protein
MVHRTILTLIFFVALVSPVVASHVIGHGGKVKIGFFSLEPISFPGENGEALGFSPDLLKKIAELEDWQPIFIHGSWGEGIDRLEADEIDLLVNVAYTEERAKNLDYNYEPSMQLWGQVFTTPNSGIKSITDLEGQKVAIQRRGINGRNFIKTTTDLGVNCEIVTYENLIEVFEAVKAGEAVAGVSPQHYGLLNASKYGLVPSSIQFSPFPIYFAVKKGLHRRLLSQIDSYLIRWKEDKDSYYYQRLNYWMGTQGRDSIIPRWAVFVVGGCIIALLLSYILNRTLQNKIIQRTSELSEQKRKLEESEAKLRLLFSESTDAVFIIDRRTGKYIDANRAAEELTGRSHDELRKLKTSDITPVGSTERIKTLKKESGSVDLGEVVYLRPDGVERIALLSAIPINENLSYGLARDITVRKRAEEERIKLETQLHQANKMEAIGTLAGGVAHDFNNMLGVILGYVQLAMRKVGPDSPLYANLDEIRKAAERSANLTRQLLAFARKQTVAPKVLDLNETVNGMINMLRRLIGEDLDLVWRPGRNLNSVFIDPSQVDQILTNLCVNARDAIADTGKITIETASASLDDAYCTDHAGFLPGEFVVLTVSDDGCGMDAETLSHLFEPFFTTKEMGKGTGLGLATVYGIAKQNNGFINVYSDPGHGTTFKIYLPQHAAKAAPRSEQEQAPGLTAGSEIILLVEDEPAILEVTSMMLDEMGYAVIEAGSPGEAIRLARQHHGRIDLLMTDVVMPEMNGRDLAGNLISIYPDIRCLFVSGYTANVIAHHGVLDPGVHFLQKPFSIKDLATKIREALDHKESDRENG